MNPSDKIKKLIDNLEKEELNTMKSNGEIMVKFFKESFWKKGFTDESFEHWEPNKKDEVWSQLRKTDNLFNSIKVESVKKNEVKVSTDVTYAKFLNEGTKYMPAREFMGNSTLLTKKIMKNISDSVNKILKIK